MAPKKHPYSLKAGMIFEKTFYGKKYRLLIVKNNGTLQFKTEDRLFGSLTAAARHVIRDETRQVSGPAFWGNPISGNKQLS